MNKEFWHERWQQGKIGFHLSDVNPHLKKWIEHAPLEKGDTLLVPLCGKSIDLIWLASLDFKVIGVELSEIAIAQFIEEHDLDVTRQPLGEMTLYSVDTLHLINGDFFSVQAAQLGNINMVYDRAALVALPREMRQRYIQHIKSLVGDDVPTLLVTMEYPQTEMEGPPFSVSEDELHEYYDKLTLLETIDLLQKEQRFKDKGVTSLVEKVWYAGGV